MHRCINNLILQNALFKNTSSNSDRKNFRKKRDTDDTQFQNCKVFKAGLLGHFFHFLFSFFFSFCQIVKLTLTQGELMGNIRFCGTAFPLRVLKILWHTQNWHSISGVRSVPLSLNIVKFMRWQKIVCHKSKITVCIQDLSNVLCFRCRGSENTNVFCANKRFQVT